MMVVAGVEYVTTAEAAAELGVEQHLIWDWARRGLITAVAQRPGRSSIYRLADLWDVERDTRKAGRRKTISSGTLISDLLSVVDASQK